jgi:hypothetical protein
MQERKQDLYFRKAIVKVRKVIGAPFPKGYLSAKKEPYFLQKVHQVRKELHKPYFRKYF